MWERVSCRSDAGEVGACLSEYIGVGEGVGVPRREVACLHEMPAAAEVGDLPVGQVVGAFEVSRPQHLRAVRGGYMAVEQVLVVPDVRLPTRQPQRRINLFDAERPTHTRDAPIRGRCTRGRR